ncbi:MAG: hypothetical protein QM604_03295 [Microbacterium sp.]
MLSTQVAPAVLLSTLPGAPVREVFSSVRLSSAQAPAVRAFREALSRSAAQPGR